MDECAVDWYDALQPLLIKYGYGDTAFEPWEDYFNEGYSPKEAIMEDMSNG